LEDDREELLETFMNTKKIDLHICISIALELAELIGKRHSSGAAVNNLNPARIRIQLQGDRPALRLIIPSAERHERSPARQEASVQAYVYVSPEQTGRMNRVVDQRSDLYVLGVLYYELLTGERLFKAETADQWIHAHMAQLPVPPRTVKPEIPQTLSDLVLKLLSKAPEARYYSAFGLLHDLQVCRQQLRESGAIASFPLGTVDELSRFRLPDKLYGRDHELRGLYDAYERACAGAMEIVLIGGRAGNGKSTLVKTVQTSIAHTQGYFISGKFDQLKQSAPYASLIRAFRDLIRQILTTDEQRIAFWKTKLSRILGRSGIVLTDVIPELTLIIGQQPPVEDLPPAESTNRFQTLFGNFMKAFADKAHPLVIWLDNLQWADAASLDLLRALINDPSNKHLLIIGTYRNNEIDAQPELHSKCAVIRHLNIDAFGYPSVFQYIADALHAEPATIGPLAKTLYRQTAGNPFYLKQMLQLLYDEKLLYFQFDKKRWEWHTQSINELEGFQDVANLIMGRFNALPTETREVLQLAGCIGSAFDLHTLSVLYGRNIAVTEQDLLPALNEGLVLTENDKFIFLHDHVQKAAYDLIPDEEKKHVHLKIGRLLLRYFHSDAADDHLFEVAHHLNLGSSLMSDVAEIEQLAGLNLQAGRKAKASAAYALALELLDKGAQLIAADGWSRNFALYASLLLEGLECRYFCGYFDQAEADLELLLLKVTDKVDRAKIYVVQITMYAFRKKEKQAGAVALKAMAEFGMRIPSKASRLSVVAEIASTQLCLARKKGRLKDLPLSRDPMHKALASIVMVSSSILFIVNAELAVIVFAKYVRMSLRQGHSEAFSIALGSYAITLSHGLKKYNTALRLAEIALDYAGKADSTLLQGKIQCIMALILQFHRPRDLGQYFHQAGQLSLEGGDLVYAGYAIASRLITESGDLRRLQQICHLYEEQAAQALDGTTLKVLYQTKQYVHLLQNATETRQLIFSNEHFDETVLLQENISSNEHKGNLYYFFTCKLEVYYLYAQYSEAVAIAEKSSELYASILLSVTQRHCFYYALAIMAAYPGTPNNAKRKYRKSLKSLFARMESWTKVVPESTVSKYRIMLAERARLDGKHAQAAKLYGEAIAWARQQDCPQDEAIANELAAQLFLSSNNHQLAEAYLLNACQAYYKWGATGKVKSLQERYPELMSIRFADLEDAGGSVEQEAAAAENKPGAEFDQQWDMDTLRQASKILTKEATETEWLEAFLHLAIHNVGAEKGIVLLSRNGELIAEAGKIINRNPDGPVGAGDAYSAAVVQFVMRTRESVVLGDARQSLFALDPYILRQRPLSILCLPIRYPDSRDGVLYLENNLTPDAFTAERLEVLEMLFSRMAYMKLWQLTDRNHGAANNADAKITPSPVESLSNREIEVLRLMAEGLSNKEIALRLSITEGTVKIHAFNLYGKLQVSRRVQAVSKARELRLLD